jgi:hypothetical protein
VEDLKASSGSLEGSNRWHIAAEALAGVLTCIISVELHELYNIELWLLEHLHLADHAVAEREDVGGTLGDSITD